MSAAATDDLLALTAAIDAGDDACLPLLADLLEERGDPRAAGLRLSFFRSPSTVKGPLHPSVEARHGWQAGAGHSHSIHHDLAVMLDRHTAPDRWGDWRLYGSRSAAYLAIAEALWRLYRSSRKARHQQSQEAREIATRRGLPQPVIDRAGSYGSDTERFATAVEAADAAEAVAQEEAAPA